MESEAQAPIAPPSQLSLYQQCVQLTDKLKLIPGFKDYLNTDPGRVSQRASSFSPAQRPDPVTLLWAAFRQGNCLCHLMNYLRPGAIPNVNPLHETQENTNLAKANVYYFRLALLNHLGISEQSLFSISDLYKDEMHGFVALIKNVETLVDRLEAEGKLDLDSLPAGRTTRSSMDAKTNREKVVMELLETERKYVNDLERLQDYMQYLSLKEIISTQHVRDIFWNLKHLLDFQRKFLIGLEDVCAMPMEQQLIGRLFVLNEQGFAVYGPYCANHPKANNLVVDLKDQLAAAESIMEPTRALPSYLIRPVQRICKYPLLLRELIRYTDPKKKDILKDIQRGYESISRVTANINEISRRELNQKIAAELEKAVDDWKGFNIRDFGDLLLDANVMIESRGSEKAVHMFLFERILISCKEMKDKKKSWSSKKLSGGNGSLNGQSYQFRGGVYIINIEGIISSTRSGHCELKVFYRGADPEEMESFAMKFLHEEPLKAWESQMNQLLDRTRRRSAPVKSRENESQHINLPTGRGASTSMITPKSSHAAESSIQANFDKETQRRRGVPKPDLRAFERTPLPRTEEESPTTPIGPVRLLPPPRHTSKHSSADLSKPLRSLDNALQELNELLEHVDEDTTLDSPEALVAQLPPPPLHAPPPVPTRKGSMNSSSSTSTQEEILPTPAITPSSQTPEPHIALTTPNTTTSNMTTPNTTTPNMTTPNTSTSTMDTMVKAKVHFQEDIFVMFLPRTITFHTLIVRLNDKIHELKPPNERAQALKAWRYKVRYEDEDGDFITMRRDEDVPLAMRLALAGSKSGGGSGRRVIHLFVDEKD